MIKRIFSILILALAVSVWQPMEASISQDQPQSNLRRGAIGGAAGKKSPRRGSTPDTPAAPSTGSSAAPKKSSPGAQPKKVTGTSSPSESLSWLSINDILFRNFAANGDEIDGYGQDLYSEDMRYLGIKVLYDSSLGSTKDETVYVKIIDPDGKMLGSGDYTFESPISFAPGNGMQTLVNNGWGSRDSSSFSPGYHTVQIWKNGQKLYSKKMRILKGSSGKSTTTSTSSSSSSSRSTVFDDFFPVFGNVKLGMTIDQLKGMGYSTSSSFSECVDVCDLDFWDHDHDGKVEQIYTVHSETLPSEWTRLGMGWDKSYNWWKDFFTNKGFTVRISKSPSTETYSGRTTFKGEFVATAPDGSISFELGFRYGNSNNEGYTANSRNTLYNMTIRKLK